MSKTTSSPAPIVRSPGSAWGSAPFGPAATIAGKEGSAPSSRIRASAAAATSRSVRPARPRSMLQRQTSSASSAAAAIAASSSLVLDPPQLLDGAAGRLQLDAVGEFLLQSRFSRRTETWSSSNPTVPARRSAIPPSQSSVTVTTSQPSTSASARSV